MWQNGWERGLTAGSTAIFYQLFALDKATQPFHLACEIGIIIVPIA